MAVPGKFGVSSTGAATYSIRVSAPPGTASLTPSLSISYSSQRGNGLLGMGWALEGLVSIGRCPRTIAQDGVHGGVNYDANDRFCLDGQRLVATSGAYGADGTEYRTEIESFSKIVSRGAAGTGPAWFEVRTKSGQVLQFGNTTDSRVLAQGKPTARDWMVNKVADTKGNYFTVTYINDTTNGQVYPNRIDYTANDTAGLVAFNSVRFVYDTARPDVVPFYHAGSLMKTTVRLTNVQTFAGPSLVADYRLVYGQGNATGRSQLTSVTLCDGASTCLPATSFTWQHGTTAVTVTANVAGQDGTLAGFRPYIGDFNGDGLTDMLWDSSSSSSLPTSSGTRVLWVNTGGSFTVQSNVGGQNGTLSGYAPIVADLNRDGKTDILWYQINASAVAVGPTTKWISTGSGAFAVGPGPPAPANHFLSMATDVNGDLRADLVWYLNPNLQTWVANADGSISAISVPGLAAQKPPGAGSIYSFSGPDLNADGITDILWIGFASSTSSASNGTEAVWFGNGNGTFTQVAGADASVNGYAPHFGDLNGDGQSDVLWDRVDSNGRSLGQRILWLSKGDGTFAVQTNVGGHDNTLSGYRPYLIDLNGDGVADILWDQVDTNGLSTGSRVLWVGKGDGNFTIVSNFAGQDGTLLAHTPIIADFNGDGRADILWDKRSGTDTRSIGTRVLWLSDASVPDIMTSIATGVGASTAMTYKSLTDGTVYTKDNSAVDPILDMQGPFFVVARVDASNGIGGTLSNAYAYTGAKVHQDGYGFLGFRQMRVTDLQTSIVHSTTYPQTYPLVTLVANETTTLGAQTLRQIANSYDFKNASGKAVVGPTSAPYHVSLTRSVASSSDLDGSTLPSFTSTYQYDAHGNATQIAVAASDGPTKTTSNIYNNDTTNWLLGRLIRANVKNCTGSGCASCSLPWGGQTTNGSSVAGYKDQKGTDGGSCVSESRTCIDGSLSGSFQFGSCTPYTPASMVFNGTNQALTRTLVTTSPTSTKFTYSFWVKLSGFDTKTNATLFQIINAPTNTQWIVTGILATGSKVGIDQNWPSPNWGEHNNASPTVSTGVWHHVVYSYDSSLDVANRIRIYQNGVLLGGGTAANPGLNAVHHLFANGRQHQIGGWLDVSRFLKGKLAFIQVLDGITASPEAFAFNNSGVWTRKPYNGAYGVYGFSLDGSSGVVGQDVGPNGQHFTGMNMSAANLDISDLPPHQSQGGGGSFALSAPLKGGRAPIVSTAVTGAVAPGDRHVSADHASMK